MYFENFKEREDVFHQFNLDDIGENFEILFAVYEDDGCYGGRAFVLYQDKQSGELYEVHGSHCSCYGLEEQWEPESTTKEAILYRIKNGQVCGYDEQLKQMLEKL